MDEGGYDALADGSGSYRDILKDKDEAVALEQEKRQVKSEDVTERLIREYETRLSAEPNNLKLLRDLAELHTSKQQFDRALEYYERIKASDMGADASLDQAVAQTIVRKYDHHIRQARPASPEHAEQTAALQAEKQAYQLAECQKRVERFPTDLVFRFEFGHSYFRRARSARPSRNSRRPRGIPTNASPR